MATPIKAQLDRIVETLIFLVTESRRLAREESARHGVTPTQLAVLKLLHETGDLRLGDLSRRIKAQNSTVTGIVDRMEEAKLVARSRVAGDRRAWKIALTPRGAKLAARAGAGHWETLRAALDSLPAGEKRKLIEILGRVADHVAATVAGEGTR